MSATGLTVSGERTTGDSIRTQNGIHLFENIFHLEIFLIFCFFFILKVMAAASLANIVKSSLGPLGLDKMLVDDIGVSERLSLFS